ncbi:MAG: hypothetical protein IJ532_05195 [Alphaproteobacteria bacterium]|nr:hypothetical protein [Alphaproteobacteria bacterium]
MTVRRLILFMLIPVISLILWSLPVFAAESCGEGCKLNDDYKKQMAQQAYTAVYDARNAYAKYVNILKKEYEAAGGSCHDLYSNWDHDALVSLFSGGLEGANELEWTDADKKGGEEVDSGKYKAKMSPTCTEMMNTIDTYKDYTDWDINKMIKMAGVSNAGIQNVLKWASGASPGSYMQVDSSTKSTICKKVTCTSNITSNSCDYLFKEANGALACVDSYGLRLPQDDGKCYNATMSGQKTQIDCYEQKHVAVRFGSVDEFKSNMIKGDVGTQRCIDKLNEAASLRGSKTSNSGFIGQRIKAHMALAALGGADTQCCCELDENGNMTDKITHCDVHDADFVDENLDETCKTAAQYQAEMGELCLTCGLMAKILGGVQKISKNAFEAIDTDLIKLLEIALLVYIGYLVLLAVASPETQKLSQFLTQLLHQGARVAIAVLVLTYPEALYDKVINPILDGGVDFGLAFSNLKADSAETGTMDIAIGEKIKTEGAEYSKEFDMSSKYLHGDTLQKLVGANKNFSREAAMMPALGRCLICNSVNNLGAKRLWFIPRVSMLITGIILLVFGVMIWLAIGFYILDCCLQLGIVAAMMSFFVACWPFKITSSYVKVGWNMFLNTFFNFIMMSVVIVTIAQLTAAALPEDLMQDINEDNVEMINDQLEIIGLSVILLVVTCLICLKLSSESGRLANKFAGGAQIKMGGDLGGMAGDMATKAAVGNMGKVGQDGKKQGVGGALGLAGRVVGGVAGSAAEASGAKGALQAKGAAIKAKLGGGTKSQGASFKPSSQGNDKGGDKPEENK